MRQNLLKNAKVLQSVIRRYLKSVADIIKCGNYYKVRRNSAIKTCVAG